MHCDICDKTINSISKSKPLNFKLHKKNGKKCIVVIEYEILQPEIDEIKILLDIVIKD